MKNSILFCALALLVSQCGQNPGTATEKQPAGYTGYKEIKPGYFLKNTIKLDQPVTVLIFSSQGMFDQYFGFGKTMDNEADNIDFNTQKVIALLNNVTSLETTLDIKSARQTADSLIFKVLKREGNLLSYQSTPIKLYSFPKADANRQLACFINDWQVPVQSATTVPSIPPTYIINDFLVAVEKTKSPYKVSKTAKYPLFGFSFTDTRLTGFTIHEGGYDTDLDLDELTGEYTGKSIPGLDSFQLTKTENGDARLFFVKSKKFYTYKKVPDVDSAVRQILMAGTYTDAKTQATITLDADGTLTGMGTEKTYQPFYDFMGPLSFDEMVVQEKADPAKTTYFHYKIKGSMLELYESIQSLPTREDPEKIGKLLYTLERVKK